MIVYKLKFRLFRHDKYLVVMFLHQDTDNPGAPVQPSQLAEDGNFPVPLSKQDIGSNRNKHYTELLWCRSLDPGPRNAIVAVHPGLLRTELARKWLHNDYCPNLLQPVCSPVINFLFNRTFLPPSYAVQAVLQAATAPASKVGASGIPLALLVSSADCCKQQQLQTTVHCNVASSLCLSRREKSCILARHVCQDAYAWQNTVLLYSTIWGMMPRTAQCLCWASTRRCMLCHRCMAGT